MHDRRLRRREKVVDAPPPRIAVLEDDDALREDILVPGIAAHGFDVEGFARPSELYRRLLATTFDVVLLDIGLPDEDGLSVARYLGEMAQTGIVVLTGRSDTGERTRGLLEAVDVWLRKPLDVDVVVASLHSLLRRLPAREQAGATQAAAEPTWTLDPANWRLTAPGGLGVALTQSERVILHKLQASPGDPVDTQSLIAELGGRSDSFDKHRLEMIMHRLRRKVLDTTHEMLPVRSVRNRGYVWIG